MKVSVGIARYPSGWSNVGQESPETTDWLIRTCKKISEDKRVSNVEMWRATDTPIPMLRNRSLRWAASIGLDYLLCIDSDMQPDCHLQGIPFNCGVDALAKPFWDTTFDFMLQHNGPSIVAAPYCGPPPHENIYVFQWGNKQSDCPDSDFSLDQFSREHAGIMGGISEVAALPTGLCMIDVRVAQIMKPPWFYYEWKDEYQDDKASTEDVTFTRDASMQGIPCYCNWDAWAAHLKLKKVGRPRQMFVEMVGAKYKEAVLADRHAGAKLVMQGDGIREWQKPKTRPKGRLVHGISGNSDGDGDSGEIGYAQATAAVHHNGNGQPHGATGQPLRTPKRNGQAPSVRPVKRRRKNARVAQADVGAVSGSGPATDQP